MDFREKISWILDKNSKRLNNDDETQKNIDFVHSLGKKCDCVGWSDLNMDEPDADKVLDEIQNFCSKKGWEARGFYERTYTNLQSDWFELVADEFKDSACADRIQVSADNGDTISLSVIRAYHELISSPKDDYGNICVPERFRDACIKHGIDDVDFCWIEDKGRYESEQYFYIYPKKLIPRVASDRRLNKADIKSIDSLGGALPKIANIFYKLQYISLPECYIKKDMPESGIAYAYCNSTDHIRGIYKILIHKDTAQMLINEKALSSKHLKAVPVLDVCPDGYTIDATVEEPKPLQSYIEEMFGKYKKLKSKSRPEYIVSDKDALKILRKEKSERKADFNKSIKKELAQTLINTQYKTLLEYYKVANGGILSDEYELLSFEESITASFELCEDLEKEELLSDNPKGIVFAKNMCGDSIVQLNSGNVICFSHEAPEAVDEWKNLAQFILEAITEN